jgi:ribosomal protein S18 acetylase RimI-like enzyme
MRIHVNEPQYLRDFIRLNEEWITRYFRIEDTDIRLARNPMRIIKKGGYIFALVNEKTVIGVCALFKDKLGEFQLTRMAVSPLFRGQGYGDMLMHAALAKLKELNASRVYLQSNTLLSPAISLYKKYGFREAAQNLFPVYSRCNIVMEKLL